MKWGEMEHGEAFCNKALRGAWWGVVRWGGVGWSMVTWRVVGVVVHWAAPLASSTGQHY